MSATRTTIAGTLALASLWACGPRLETLTSERHYREAVCAASDGGDDDRGYVHQKLVADLDPKLHVAVVDSYQIDHALGGAGDLAQITARARFVRVRLESNVVPLDDLDADISVTAHHRLVGSAIDWSTLAAITGEKLPPSTTESTYVHGGTLLQGLAALLTVGVSLPFTKFRQRTYVVEPSLAAYKRTAPAAFRLHAAMDAGRGCDRAASRTHGAGVTCTWYLALDPRIREPLVLELSLAYGAIRAKDRGSSSDACRVSQTSSIQLGTVDALDARTSQTFGPRMRPLRELVFE